MDSPLRDSMSNIQGTRRLRARKSIAHMPSPERTLDKENNAQELARPTQETKQQISTNASKKSRSKSLGPGGLDALKDTSGNRRKSAAFPQPKSILKPTIPLSPLREIPTRRNQPHPTDIPASPAKSPRPSRTQDDVSPSKHASIRGNELKQSSQAVAHHDATESDAIGTAATVDPEAEERQKRKNEIQKQRDARRKSMANRRVSFAPDATLHTWDTEVLEDSTSSSASTASSRRASAFSQSQGPTSDRPTTPAERTEDPLVQRSPEPQRSAHQKKRRRSSGIPPMNFNNPDVLSSSPYSGSSAVDEDETVDSFVDGEVTISGSDHGDGTLNDATMQSVEDEVSFAIPEDTKDNGELDASLQDAAERAGTRNMEIDENGEISMEIAGDEVTAAFKPWVRQSTGVSSPHPAKTMIKPGDDKINPFSPAFKQATGKDGSPNSFADDLDMSMDMTNAVGGIRTNGVAKPIGRRKSVAARRQSIAQHRRTSEEGPDLGEGTMDFTTAVGGLQRPSRLKHDQMALDENEELSMEFTSVFGGVNSYVKAMGKAEQTPSRNSPNLRPQHASQSDLINGEDDEDGDMEMTTSIGGILPQQSLKHDHEEGVESQVIAGASTNTSAHGRDEVHALDNTQFASSTLAQQRNHDKTEAATTGPAPESSPAAHSNRRSLPHYAQPTIASSTPSKVPQTPTHQVTPQPTRPTTPGKTPPSANVSMRKTSPKKLFQQEIRAAKSPSQASPGVFRKDGSNGHQTPSVVLAPKLQAHRRTSGVGIDKQGLGSPGIAALLDRRTSIGGSSDVFAPKGTLRTVKFDDPRPLDVEISKDLEEDQRSESGQLMTAFEIANEGETDATVTLKDMMQSMTPKKNKLKGRKSLAVGAARGVSGKRPAELDSEDDLSPRTFGNASSPVKRIRLNDPSMFPEASVRSARNTQARLIAVSGNGGSKIPNDRTSPTASPIAKQMGANKVNGRDMPEDKIGLQDFLNLTNIRFMELTTTKRRATIAPSSYHDTDTSESEDPNGIFVKSVTAGACTIPMLELYQHACRELKSYISEGRNVVRSIEEESLVENPPLFREYLTATPSTRQVMDNQFKHMKTNARLLSKATWYEWRMKLLDGLVESLTETAKGLERDDDVLSRRETILFPHISSIVSEQADLERQFNDLKSRAIELAKYDPEDLDAARERLKTVNLDIESKSRTIETNQESLEDLDEQIAAARNARNEAQDEIEEARRQREDCRGWSVTEVRASQTRVEHLTSQTGWSVTGATGSSLRLSFEKQVELSFDTRAFLPLADRNASPRLGLIYTGNEAESTIARFFIQYLRAQLHALTPSSTEAAKLLRFVASGWSCARAIQRQVAHLRLRAGTTETRIVNDERMTIDVDVLLHGVKTKVKVAFELQIGTGAEETIHASAQVGASVVYGEEYREDRMSDFVKKRISGDISQDAINGHQDGEAEGAWAGAVVELRKGLIRRGAK